MDFWSSHSSYEDGIGANRSSMTNSSSRYAEIRGENNSSAKIDVNSTMTELPSNSSMFELINAVNGTVAEDLANIIDGILIENGPLMTSTGSYSSPSASGGSSPTFAFNDSTNGFGSINATDMEIGEQPIQYYRQDWQGSMYPSGYSTLTIIITSIFLTTMMIIVVIGNMLVCIAIATEKSLKTTHNSFIASLAVSDFLLGLIIMPFSLARDLMGYWIFGVIWCEMWLAIDVLLSTASILNLCLISLDRYWSITQAVDYLKKRTPRRAAAMIFFVWVFAAIISLPPLVGWKDVRPQETFPKCFVSTEIGYVLYSAAGSFYIPAIVMVFVYIRIFFAARSRAFRNVKRKPQYPEITADHMRDKSTTTTTNTTTTSFSNASPPDGVGKTISCSVDQQQKSPLIIRKLPFMTKIGRRNVSTDSDSTVGSDQDDTNKSEVTKDKNSNTSNSLLIPPSSATPPATSPSGNQATANDQASNQGAIVIGGVMKKPDRSPSNEKKIVTLGGVEFKHLSRSNAVALSDHRELSEICEDGEDMSQTQTSSEVEESTTVANWSDSRKYGDAKADSTDDSCGDKEETIGCISKTMCIPYCMDFDVDVDGANHKCKTRKKNRQKQTCKDGGATTKVKHGKGQRSKKGKKNKKDVAQAQSRCVHTAAENERLKRRLARAKERRATLILGLIMAAFILCWLPFFTTYVVQAILEKESEKWAFSFVFWLGYCNSALNPIIYTIFNRDFRKAFRKILFK